MDKEGAWWAKPRVKNLLGWAAMTGRRAAERKMVPKNLLSKRKMLVSESIEGYEIQCYAKQKACSLYSNFQTIWSTSLLQGTDLTLSWTLMRMLVPMNLYFQLPLAAVCSLQLHFQSLTNLCSTSPPTHRSHAAAESGLSSSPSPDTFRLCERCNHTLEEAQSPQLWNGG